MLSTASIHLLQTYVIPILVYGLEVVLPTGVHLDTCSQEIHETNCFIAADCGGSSHIYHRWSTPSGGMLEHWACMVISLALKRLRLKSSWPEDNLVSKFTEEAAGSLKSDIFVSNTIYQTLIHSWIVSHPSFIGREWFRKR